jgi:hypothetical protein
VRRVKEMLRDRWEDSEVVGKGLEEEFGIAREPSQGLLF